MVKCSNPMDLRPADENSLLCTTIREFAETETASHILTFRETGGFPAEILPRFDDLWSSLFSSRYGSVAVRGDRQLSPRYRKSAVGQPFSSGMVRSIGGSRSDSAGDVFAMDYPAGSFSTVVKWATAGGGTGNGQGDLIVWEQLGRFT